MYELACFLSPLVVDVVLRVIIQRQVLAVQCVVFSLQVSSDLAVDSRPALLGIFASCSMEKCAQSMLRLLGSLSSCT